MTGYVEPRERENPDHRDAGQIYVDEQREREAEREAAEQAKREELEREREASESNPPPAEPPPGQETIEQPS